MSGTNTLNDLCSLIVDCEHKTAPLAASGFPSIRTPNVGRGRLVLEGVNRVDAATFEAWTQRAVPRADDLIIAREAPVGNVAIIPAGLQVCLGQRTVLVRPDPTKVCPAYLCYFLLGDYVQQRFRSSSIGSTVPHLNMKDIRSLPLPRLHTLAEQRRVAAILTAYDDLIEVNRRRGALLEVMARGLFEEWFVCFRFPGHQGAVIIDTQDGPLPQGWSWAGLGQLATFRSGNNKLTKSSYRPEGYTAYSASGPDGFVDIAEHNGQAVVVSSVGAYCGKTWLADGKWTAIANTLCAFPREGVPAEFIFLGTRGIAKWPRRGAAQPFIAKTDAASILLPRPPMGVWSQFRAVVGPMLSSVSILAATNSRLAASRDLLLPGLISGQLSVAEAERELAQAA